MERAICLVGFMGSGKTTIGEALSRATQRKWIDLDHFIEEEAGCSIPDIFSEKGEAYFRTLEAACLKKVLSEANVVISTGGGIILDQGNRDLLKLHSTFYLNYDFDTLFNRIAGDANRPLATSYEEVKTRFEMRKLLYEVASTHQISCEGKTVQSIVEVILESL